MGDAYTRIDAGIVRLGNRYMERSWSALLGKTTSLYDRCTEVEWISKTSPEFQLRHQKTPIRPYDLSEMEWSEHADSLGCAVAARYASESFCMTITTRVFHGIPGLWRSYVMRNMTRETQCIDRAALELLAVASGAVRIFTQAESLVPAPAVWRADAPSVVALERAHSGLFLGMQAPGAYGLFAPEPDCCAVVTEEALEIPSGKERCFPDTCIMPYTGPREKALSGPYAALLAQIREWNVNHQKHPTT